MDNDTVIVETNPTPTHMPVWGWLIARILAFGAAAVLPVGANLVALAVGWVLMLEGPHRKGIVPTAIWTVIATAINFGVYWSVSG